MVSGQAIDVDIVRAYYHGSIVCDIGGDGSVQVPDLPQKTVAFLYTDSAQGKQAKGTAFFVHIIEHDIPFNYLITCKHCVEPLMNHPNTTIYCRLNRYDKPDVVYCPLPKQESDWLFHSDPAVDLAVLPWRPTRQPVYFAAHYFEDILLTKERLEQAEHEVGAGDEVIFIGLFHQYAGHSRNIPVVRFGRIALVTNELL